MPPKKKVADDGAETGGDGAFRWTPENELTLLLLTMGRAPTKDDYVKLVEALPPGTNWNAIRQRFSKLRKDQAKRFEELGWEVPDAAASKTPTKTPAKITPKKRAGGGEEAGDAETESPTKKPRARKPKKEVVKKEVDEDDAIGGAEVADEGVKDELIDEDV